MTAFDWPPELVLAFVLAGKWVIYSAWCRYGLAILSTPRAGSWKTAAWIGLVRSLTGLALGLLAWGVVLIGFPAYDRLGTSWPALVVTFVLARWIEWSIASAVIARDRARVERPSGGRDVFWRVAGMAISFLTDAGGFAGGLVLIGGIC